MNTSVLRPVLLAFFLSLLPVFAMAQKRPACGYDKLLSQINLSPEIKVQFDSLRQQIRWKAGQLKKRDGAQLRLQPNTYIIPVVVHLVGQDAANLTDAQIQTQLDVLNQAFANQLGSVLPVSDDAQIKFCLAKKTPSSATTTGIVRYTTSAANTLANNHNMSLTGANSQQALTTTSAYWDPLRYLNIWVVKRISFDPSPYSNTVLGYSPFPLSFFSGQPFNLDGVVMRLDAFGNPSTLANYNMGRTLAHEVGHYLGLFHTFQQACLEVSAGLPCNAAGDDCCDTPPVYAPNQNNCVSNNSCTESPNLPDQIANHMDYAYDGCRTTFTEDQADRMHAVIQLFRDILVSYGNLVQTGVACLPAGLNASFTTNQPSDLAQVCAGQPLGFDGPPGAATYTWNFPGGVPVTATVQNPTGIVFSTPGIHTVTLQVADNLGNTLQSTLDIFVVGCTPYSGSQAQWYFGRNGVVTFAGGYAQPGTASAINSVEACASVCNSAGNLLFYTDGRNVFNANHLPMNGTNPVLNGSPNSWATGNDISSAQGALIVPRPNTPGRYYIFTTSDLHSTSPVRYGLTYYEVDMSLNGGLGQVITPAAGINPSENYTTTEHLAAIPHCNGTDYWIIVKPLSNSWGTLVNPGPLVNVNNYVLAYRLTSTGLAGTPVASSTSGLVIPNTTGSNSWIGQIDVSWDKKLVAFSEMHTGSIHLFAFDCQSGVLTYKKKLTGVDGYTTCFSPDGKVLYGKASNTIKQFDLRTFSDCNTNVPTLSIPYISGVSSPWATLQCGPDGRVYVSKNYTFGSWSSLAIINYPNNVNSTSTSNECGLNPYGLFLPGRLSKLGLPNMIDAVKTPPPADFRYCVKNCGEVHFENLGCGVTFSWNFGDGATSTAQHPVHTYSALGTYNVSLSINGGAAVTHAVTIALPPAPVILGPNPVCLSTMNNLSYFGPPGYTYNWSATNASPGSGVGSVFNLSWLSLPATLSLTITDPQTGCASASSIQVTGTTAPPVANAGPDYKICPPAAVTLNGSGTGALSWSPSTGLSCTTCPNPVANPASTTTYTLTASNGCGSASDQTTVTVCCEDGSCCACLRNLVTNGDFNSGNTGFASAYLPSTALAGLLPGQYVVTDAAGAAAKCSSWNIREFFPCTAVGGSFMIVNGSTGQMGPKKVWEQTITGIQAGKQPREYKFCANFRNLAQCCFDVKPKINIVFSASGFNISNQVVNLDPNNPCDWLQVEKRFTPAGPLNLTIQIWLDEAGAGDGNDVAVDDIALYELPQANSANTLLALSSTPVSGGAYGVTAVAANPVPEPECGYFWDICGYDPVAKTCINNTQVSNPPQWWTGSAAPNPFTGYNGTSTLSGLNPGVFQVGKTYRVSLGVYCECAGWNQSVYLFSVHPLTNQFTVQKI
ncbi:MAG: PKD domain-containing protein [Saprospirales bacterium]|nr:PKD domain-containing protein [Saprospirales bacterium]